MVLVATLKELKSTMARKLPIEVKIMGDEDAPAWAPETQRIAPKTAAARQFNPFDKLVVGARDKQNNYVLLFFVSAKKIVSARNTSRLVPRIVSPVTKCATNRNAFIRLPLLSASTVPTQRSPKQPWDRFLPGSQKTTSRLSWRGKHQGV